MTKTYVDEFLENAENMRLYQQERSIYEVTELLESLMNELGISRATLAKRLGKSRGWITQLLDGEANKTIRTVADAFAVLGHEYRSSCQPIQASHGATDVILPAAAKGASAPVNISSVASTTPPLAGPTILKLPVVNTVSNVPAIMVE